MITCGLVQAASKSCLFDNINTVKQYVEKAKDMNCQILCFPEGFLTGYSSKNAKEIAISRNHSVFTQIQLLALNNQIDLLLGYLEQDNEYLYITHDIFTSGGQRYSYRKTHLGDREKLVFTEGVSLDVFPLSNGLTAGIQLCVENHYPDITRTYSLKGAQIVFAPHAVPRAAGDREKIWKKFIPARSYDNRVYMACCNQWGGCFVTDPAGEVIASYFDEEDTLVCFSFDETEVEKYHCGSSKMSAQYYPSKRKPELYL